MKQKILEALKQGYKNLGLSEEAFERVAALGETFITGEEQIATFVKGAESILKAQQSEADKARSKASEEKKALEDKIAALEAQLNGNQPPIQPQQAAQQPTEQPDLVAQFAALLDSKLNPLQERITAFEAEKASQSAIDFAKKEFFELEIVKANQGVGNVAWEHVLDKFNADGKKWDKDKLLQSVKDDFNATCSKLNIDTTAPAKSENAGGGHDFEGFASRLKERGKIAADSAEA